MSFDILPSPAAMPMRQEVSQRTSTSLIQLEDQLNVGETEPEIVEAPSIAREVVEQPLKGVSLPNLFQERADQGTNPAMTLLFSIGHGPIRG